MRNIRIDEEKCEKKWGPIFSSIGYKGTQLRKLAMYCEIHSILDHTYVCSQPGAGLYTLSPVQTTEQVINQNLLPMSVRILTKLNLDSNINFITNGYEDEEEHYVEIKLSKSDVNRYKLYYKEHNNNNFDIVQMAENNLMNSAIEKINEDINTAKIINTLKSSDTDVVFNTGKLTSNIELLEDRIRLKLKYTIK